MMKHLGRTLAVLVTLGGVVALVGHRKMKGKSTAPMPSTNVSHNQQLAQTVATAVKAGEAAGIKAAVSAYQSAKGITPADGAYTDAVKSALKVDGIANPP